MQYEIRKTEKSNIVNFSKLKYGFDPQLLGMVSFWLSQNVLFNLILIFFKMCFIVIVVN